MVYKHFSSCGAVQDNISNKALPILDNTLSHPANLEVLSDNIRIEYITKNTSCTKSHYLFLLAVSLRSPSLPTTASIFFSACCYSGSYTLLNFHFHCLSNHLGNRTYEHIHSSWTLISTYYFRHLLYVK